MDIILIAVEFGSHKIRSSRVLYSVIVKCVSSNNQIKKVEVWHCVDEFCRLKDHIEHHPNFTDLGITFKPFLQTSFWQSEKDPKVINQRSKEFSEFISLIQKSIFLLTTSPVKFFCQGYILDDSGSQKKRRVTVGCCRRRKSSCWTGTEKEKSFKEPESFVDISCSDFRPYYKEYDQVKDQLRVAGGKYSSQELRKKFEVPKLLVLSDEDLTLLLENKAVPARRRSRYPSSDCTAYQCPSSSDSGISQNS
ncbi:hypothetical protein ACHWQZ_G003015 [Mnemiopsis leidyi]